MTTTEDIALVAIEREVRAHGAELVIDYHDHRNSNMLTAIRLPSMDPIGERVSVSVGNAGVINASVFSPTGGPNSFSSGTPKPTPGWVSITAGLDTNDQRVLAVVNLLVPAAEQERPPKGALCGDCGESIVDGEDPWEWSEDIGDFVHARCIDEPEDPDACDFSLDPSWHQGDPGPFRPCETCGVGEEQHDDRPVLPHREGILTVGELKAALEGIANHVHVCITADGPDGAVINDGWWNNVADIIPPGDDGTGQGENEGHFTFDLVVGGEFDTRQF